ncbi:type IV pilus modification protein PilV [Massilia sp. METH4]|uniref:type IV pilus modification protein PilV n=1 Tax=Massilia sp. METH4 TaxID=3123041 RepID=UPI0030CA640C
MRHVAGFALMEVLVAVFVLALGLVGGMAMQLHAMRARHESALLSAALQIAVAMADRMRANAGQVPVFYLDVDYDAQAATGPAALDNPCTADSCNPAQVAQADIHELQRQVRTQLPAGRARVCRDAQLYEAGRMRWECSGAPGDPVVVKIGWRGKRADGTPERRETPGVAVTVAGVGQ